MKPQERAIIDAVEGGFNLPAPFMTNAEVVKVVQLASATLGSPYNVKGEFGSTTLKNWLNRGVFAPYRRLPGLRNYLYSAVDVAALLTIQYFTDFGLPVQASAAVSKAVVGILENQKCELDSDEHRLIFISRWPLSEFKKKKHHDDAFRIVVPDFESTPSIPEVHDFLRKNRVASVHVFDWKWVTALAITASRNMWNEKAKALVDKLDREIAAKQGDAHAAE